MSALKSRQRGHGDYGLLLWLITATPWILGAAALTFVGLIVWAIVRLCK